MFKYQITNDTIKGRSCISNKNIRKGETILIEKPFLVIDIKEYKNIVQTLKLKINLLSKLMNLAPETKYVHIDESNVEKYLKEIIKKIKTNAFSYNSEKSIAMLYFGSFFNHSCDPNLYYYQSGDKIIFKACKNIVVKEELCISYIQLYSEENYINRNERLKNWNFVCKCFKCKTDKLFEIKELIAKYQEAYENKFSINMVPSIFKYYLD